MHLAHLSLHDFRSYTDAEVPLGAGVTGFYGPNGHGKTNLVEAVHYTATQTSHRVATDAPLVRSGAERAVVRGEVARDGRRALVELEINPGRSNRARLNRAPVPRAREVLGVLRTVLFAPEDLALVKGEPGERRRFLDDLLVVGAPRFAGVRADYDRVLRQRSMLLKTAGAAWRAGTQDAAATTLDVWDAHLARTGGELLAARLELVAALEPLVQARYSAVAGASAGEDAGIRLRYRASVALPPPPPRREAVAEALLDEIGKRRSEEVERGVCLVGPHRDDVHLQVGPLPAKGYASQGECWSLALALRLASYDLLSADGERPVLVLDDVFAELDVGRRDRLAELVSAAEQVLVTAAVPGDVPPGLVAQRFDVRDGSVRRAG